MGYTYLDLIYEVLQEQKEPMSIADIWKCACEKKYDEKLSSVGKTPLNTMNALIHKNIENEKSSKFKQVSKKPALFDLN